MKLFAIKVLCTYIRLCALSHLPKKSFAVCMSVHLCNIHSGPNLKILFEIFFTKNIVMVFKLSRQGVNDLRILILIHGNCQKKPEIIFFIFKDFLKKTKVLNAILFNDDNSFFKGGFLL